MYPTAKELIEQTFRTRIKDMLETLELEMPGATAKFHRIHNDAPYKGFDNCPPEDLPSAYELVRRSFK